MVVAVIVGRMVVVAVMSKLVGCDDHVVCSGNNIRIHFTPAGSHSGPLGPATQGIAFDGINSTLFAHTHEQVPPTLTWFLHVSISPCRK